MGSAARDPGSAAAEQLVEVVDVDGTVLRVISAPRMLLAHLGMG